MKENDISEEARSNLQKIAVIMGADMNYTYGDGATPLQLATDNRRLLCLLPMFRLVVFLLKSYVSYGICRETTDVLDYIGKQGDLEVCRFEYL